MLKEQYLPALCSNNTCSKKRSLLTALSGIKLVQRKVSVIASKHYTAGNLLIGLRKTGHQHMQQFGEPLLLRQYLIPFYCCQQGQEY
jgi:hypothetical protein